MAKVSKRARLAFVTVAALTLCVMSSEAVALNPNRTAIANGLQGLVGVPNAASTLARIGNMSPAETLTLYDQVSPEAYGAYAVGLQDQGNLFTRQVRHRLATARSGADRKLAVWGNLYGQWGKFKSSTFRFGSYQDIFGGAIGVDGQVGSDFILGVTGGYSEDKVKYLLGNSKGTSNSWQIGGYAGYHPGRLRADLQIAYVKGNIDAKKNVNVGSGISAISGVATASTNANLFRVIGALGYQLGNETVSVVPFVGIDLGSGHINSFNEHGTMGPLALHVDQIKMQRVDVLAGVKVEPHIGRLTPYGDATVRYFIKRDSGNFRAYFDGIPSDGFIVSAQRPYMMQFELNGGLSYAIASNSSIFFGYFGTFRRNVSEKNARVVSTNGVNGGVKISF